MDQEVRVDVRSVNEATVFDITGDVTSAAEGSLVGPYEAQTEAGVKRFVLNFTAVDYINSSGIAIVINLVMRMRKQNQQMTIFGLTPHFQKMFKIVGVDRYAKVCQTEPEALGAG